MKTRFFLIIGCILLAGAIPHIAAAAFGIIGGVAISLYVILGIITLLSK